MMQRTQEQVSRQEVVISANKDLIAVKDSFSCIIIYFSSLFTHCPSFWEGPFQIQIWVGNWRILGGPLTDEPDGKGKRKKEKGKRA